MIIILVIYVKDGVKKNSILNTKEIHSGPNYEKYVLSHTLPGQHAPGF
jgi:hypothetical protein